jgi:hypothetical protein
MKQNNKLNFVGMTISSILIKNVETILRVCLREAMLGKSVRQGINTASLQAIPAYFTAVAAVEAFLNEQFLDIHARAIFKDNPLWYIPEEDLEYWDLEKKLLLVPKFLFTKTFDKNSKVFKEMVLLIQVRNYLTHYKTTKTPKKSFNDLEQRRITLQDQTPGATFTWAGKFNCTEGVRWAHNTACNTITELMNFSESIEWYAFSKSMYQQYGAFAVIPESYIHDWFANNQEGD